MCGNPSKSGFSASSYALPEEVVGVEYDGSRGAWIVTLKGGKCVAVEAFEVINHPDGYIHVGKPAPRADLWGLHQHLRRRRSGR